MDCPVCRAPLDGSPKFCARCGSATESVGVKSATAVAPATEAEPRYDPFIGQTVGGRYKIVKLLGEGGMGAVYVGEQNIGGTIRKVAIKTLHAHLSKDPKILTRFERECATVAELQHPNTIQLYDFGKTDDGILYMVMEFVQGESLAGILEKQHSLEPGRALHILQQICDALGEAHTLGIVHRDLKPENIVLTERAKDWVKVLDFGIAKRSEAGDKDEQKLTQQGTVLGTPPYMSPEQFTGRSIDARSDIYSIAVIGYEMLAGRLPFKAATPWEWATQHMTATPTPLSVTPSGAAIPESMVYAIMRSLSKDPADRFASTRDFFESMAVPPTNPEGLAVSGGYAMAPASMLAGASFNPASLAAGVGSASQALTPRPTGGGFGTPSSMPHAVGGPGGDPATPIVGERGKTQIGEPTPGAIEAFAAPPGSALANPPYGSPPTTTPKSNRRGGAGIVVAIVVVVGFLAVGGIVYALTRTPSRHVASRDTPRATGGEDGGQPSSTEPGKRVPLIDTSLPELPTTPGLQGHNGSHHPDAGTPYEPPVSPPSNDPHSCKTARSLQTKLSHTQSPSMGMLNNFNHERAKCISEGGHM